MEDRSHLIQALSRRKQGHCLPREFYVDEAIFRHDLELLFHREWLFAGHECEVSEPGSYFTFDVGDYSLIILRDAEHRIRAFHNTCRHRGSRLCEQTKGKTRKLVCPYHQWTYALDGRLTFARDMGEHFDAAQYGLKTAHCRTVGGYVFICLAERAPDFDGFEAALKPHLLPHGLRRARVAHESRIVEDGNWKLVFENNRECYHCPVGHPELTRTFPPSPYSTGPVDLAADPLYQALWKRLESEGIPTGRVMAPSGQYRVFRNALQEPGGSMTRSGEPAVARLLGGLNESRLGTGLVFHYPNTWNHLMADHSISFRVTPLTPDRTELVTKWLVHEDAVEGEDYDLETLTEVWLATNQQDCRFVELAQTGIRSPTFEPGPCSEIQELGVVQFDDWYCAQMTRRSAPAAPHVQAV